jgi:hypothetical protein
MEMQCVKEEVKVAYFMGVGKWNLSYEWGFVGKK